MENQYFEAKDVAENDPQAGLDAFQAVLDMEQEKCKWGFKALKRMCKLGQRLGRHADVKRHFMRLLKYTKSAVTLNESEKALNSLLDHLKDHPNLTELYDATLETFRADKNEKACVRLELKLAKVLFQQKNYTHLARTLAALRRSCQLPDGRDDPSKGSQLMEIYAQEIQMYTDMGDNTRLKALYQRALKIKAAIPAPRITGIIHECGGKMWMREKRWEKAHVDFFEAFKNYDEAGSPRRIACLKYLVLASMLMGSDIDPFEETRAKSYKTNEEIASMIALVEAYDRSDIHQFEKLLRENKKAIMDDEFVRGYIEDLLANIRTQVLLKTLKPYTRISLDFISRELGIPLADVERLLVSLILDSKVRGRVDQISGLLELEGAKSENAFKYRALRSWSKNVETTAKTVSSKLR
jgi:COP9 signalosome complex subunit 2